MNDSVRRKKISCIALDLDGTTLRDDKGISEANRKAIEDAVRAGIKVVIASGRSYSSLPESVTSIPGIEYAVTSNGGRGIPHGRRGLHPQGLPGSGSRGRDPGDHRGDDPGHGNFSGGDSLRPAGVCGRSGCASEQCPTRSITSGVPGSRWRISGLSSDSTEESWTVST